MAATDDANGVTTVNPLGTTRLAVFSVSVPVPVLRIVISRVLGVPCEVLDDVARRVGGPDVRVAVQTLRRRGQAGALVDVTWDCHHHDHHVHLPDIHARLDARDARGCVDPRRARHGVGSGRPRQKQQRSIGRWTERRRRPARSSAGVVCGCSLMVLRPADG